MKLTLITITWLLFIAGTFHTLMTYSGRAGASALTSSRWPAKSLLNRPFTGNHLVMFVHPGCSCSKASLLELDKIISAHANVTADIVFMKTAKLSRLIRESDLVSIAQQIPRVNIQFDQNGTEAQNFGARTSGHVFVYNPYGGLVFNGGITKSRGHEGENTGSRSIAEFLEKERVPSLITSVFGCELFGEKKVQP